MKVCRWLLLLGFGLVALASCDPEEEIPSIIEIPAITVSDRNGISATTEKITDAWVYINDDFRGIYQLPATIPHLDEGDVRITVFGGVKKNGIAKSRADYPFFRPFETNITLSRNERTEVLPEVTYATNLVFPVEESFEDVNLAFTRANSSSASLERGSDPNILRTGNFYGEIQLDRNDTNQFYTGFTQAFTLPQGGRQVWLEIDFACDNEIEVGITPNYLNGSAEYIPLIYLNPTFSQNNFSWNKIYIDLTPNISGITFAREFQIVITARLDEGDETGSIYLDNINLIHRQQ